MKVLESSENYLETIYMLKKKRGIARSVDVANELGFSKASVSVAMKQLRENDYVMVESGGDLVLTEKGLDIAMKVYQRHVVVSKLLESMGVSSEIAEQDACKIEHVISDETFLAIKDFVEKK